MSIAPQRPPTWQTPAGVIVGRRDGRVVRATGIRYARAGRFERPVPEPGSPTPIHATEPGPACPQPVAPLLESLLTNPLGDLERDEDCLHLSVTAPANVRPDDRLPVIVWIHGGAYIWGAGDAPVFDPASLVMEQGVIVVNVTYRLGIFGYLHSRHSPANLGLLDQLEALRWVKNNIAAFGGDPENITASGQSAGADAVAHLMIADGAKGLFRRAVLASPPLGVLPNRARMYAAMARAADLLPADLPVDDLVAAQRRIHAGVQRFGLKAAMAYGVEYGRTPLPRERDRDEAWRAAAPDIDLLIGWTAREGALFTVAALARLTRTPVVGPLSQRAAVEWVTRVIYAKPSQAFAARHAAAGGRGYRYRLDFGAPGNPYRAAHMIDGALMFDRPDVWADSPLLAGLSPARVDEAGQLLREIWGGFARTGTVAPIDRAGVIRLSPLA
ncbi:MAG TPA: carboxylesterase family protein [Propionibacterium sp.]|jgi:para-nitrobenzyl esterase|nr:carboxylesterase family protein [Propionibacterium sp.]